MFAIDHHAQATQERDAWARQMEADFRSHQGMRGPRPVGGSETGFANRFPAAVRPLDAG